MNDYDYMELALAEAKKSFEEDNLPIGAVLVINNQVIGTSRNEQNTKSNFFSHAESRLVGQYASQIKESSINKEGIEIFTILEPCLMCMGTMAHNRITRIVYACPDPLAGSSSIKPPTEWYQRKWPEIIIGGIYKEEAYELFTGFMKQHLDIWENALKQYETIRKLW